MSDFVSSTKDPVIRAPLELVLCKKCTLVQLRHTAPQEFMYKKHYWYKSGLNPVITNDLHNIAKQAIEMAKPKDGDVFLDIGCNDGSIFDAVPNTMKKVGCEPAINLKDEFTAKCDHAIADFWSVEAYNKLGLPKAKIVIAAGMFYDSEDPNKFVGDIKECLADDGLFVAQLMTLVPMISKRDVGNICHEHLEYYSYKSLCVLFERNGLEIFKVEKNTINGGSYRLFARHKKTKSAYYQEPKLRHKLFAQEIEKNKKKTVEFIKWVVERGDKVYGYGASTKANTILQYYGLDNELITGVADKNPEKIGKFMVGSNIPVVSEDEARDNAQYFFILPYAFVDTFVEREAEWRNNGGLFIVSTPSFKVF